MRIAGSPFVVEEPTSGCGSPMSAESERASGAAQGGVAGEQAETMHNDLDTPALGDRVREGVVKYTQRNSVYEARSGAALNQHT